jgi:hypothetical protein
VLRTLLTAVPIDRVNAMGIPPDDPTPKRANPWSGPEYRHVLRESRTKQLEPILKWTLQGWESPDHALTIQTGDQALGRTCS